MTLTQRWFSGDVIESELFAALAAILALRPCRHATLAPVRSTAATDRWRDQRAGPF
jgi:hypothetical protein